jgi:hypothetical protein
MEIVRKGMSYGAYAVEGKINILGTGHRALEIAMPYAP